MRRPERQARGTGSRTVDRRLYPAAVGSAGTAAGHEHAGAAAGTGRRPIDRDTKPHRLAGGARDEVVFTSWSSRAAAEQESPRRRPLSWKPTGAPDLEATRGQAVHADSRRLEGAKVREHREGREAAEDSAHGDVAIRPGATSPTSPRAEAGPSTGPPFTIAGRVERHARRPDQRCGWASGEGRRRGAIVTAGQGPRRRRTPAGPWCGASAVEEAVARCLKPATLTPWRATGTMRA